MRSFNSFTSTKKSPKLFSLALATLMTFAPLIFFANHSFTLGIKTSTHQVVEMRLLKDLIQSSSLSNQPRQLVIPNVVSVPSSVFDTSQSNQSENSITQPTFPIEVVQPKTLNLHVSPKARDSFNKSSQSPIKQLIEEESIKASKKQNEKFANDVKNSAKPDCLNNDHGLGLFNVVPLIYDIVKDKCN
jgi:preprotein translocase subunit SecF